MSLRDARCWSKSREGIRYRWALPSSPKYPAPAAPKEAATTTVTIHVAMTLGVVGLFCDLNSFPWSSPAPITLNAIHCPFHSEDALLCENGSLALRSGCPALKANPTELHNAWFYSLGPFLRGYFQSIRRLDGGPFIINIFLWSICPFVSLYASIYDYGSWRTGTDVLLECRLQAESCGIHRLALDKLNQIPFSVSSRQLKIGLLDSLITI